MLEHHQTPTDAIPPNPGSVPNENFSLTSLVQPPQQGEKFPMSRDTSTPTPATFSKYLTDMTIHDTDLNRAVDGYFAKADTDQNGYVDRNEVENSKDNPHKK